MGLIIIIQPVSANDMKSAKEYRINLDSTDDKSGLTFYETPPPIQGVTATLVGRVPGPPPRQRNPELSSMQLVLIAYDTQKHEVTRVVIADPRLIRAETVGSSGQLETKIIYRKNVDFTVVLPDDPNIKRLKIYHPHWTGTNFILELIGETQLP